MKKAWTFLKQLWALIVPYFKSEEKWRALAIAAFIVSLNLFMVYLQVQYSFWNNRFYTALQKLDEPAFWHELMIFVVIAFVFISVAVLQYVVLAYFQIRWRSWLTRHFLVEWMQDQAYYRLQLDDYGTDNPDQRIADDVNMFVTDTSQLTLGFISNVVTLVSFVGILWSLSGSLDFTLFGMEISIPGFMFWVALAYAIVGTWITHLIGRKLIALNFTQQKVEADFRFDLVRVRENAEGIALYHGEPSEQQSLLRRFKAVVDNFLAIVRRRKYLVAFNVFFNQTANIFPLIVQAPRYFARQIEMGDMMQTAQAFGQVQGSLSWFVDAYTSLASWAATVQRLTSFTGAMAKAKALMHGLDAGTTADGSVRTRDLLLTLPNGKSLLRAELALSQGEDVLVTGQSGSGKSTLFRALAGLWPFGRGQVFMPVNLPSEKVLFLPQKPYMPIGSLRAAVSYPAPEGTVDDAPLRQALADVELESFVGRLDESQHWQMRLSGGELQRLSIARALVQKPDWLFLDEATSAMEEAQEQKLYLMLRKRLPNTTVVSIGHRSSLKAFHDREIRLQPGSDGVSTVAAE